MKTPVLIKICSILLFVVAIASLLFSFIALAFSGFGKPGLNQAHIGIVVGIVLALFFILTGIGIWKGKNWARIISLILTGAWSIFWVFQIRDTSNLIFFLPGLTVFTFLLSSFFQNDCKLFFKDTKSTTS